MSKADLWKESIITIVIVLSLVAFDRLKKEWIEFKKDGFRWGIIKKN